MARVTAEVVPGEVSQEQFDAKFNAKTTDDLVEGTKKYDTGVPPATQDDLPSGTTAKQFSTTEQTKLTEIEAGAEVNPADLAALDPTANTKLTGIEEDAKGDQTGTEIQTAIEGLADADRKIMISEPLSGEYKIHGIHRNAVGHLEYEHEETPKP